MAKTTYSIKMFIWMNIQRYRDVKIYRAEKYNFEFVCSWLEYLKGSVNCKSCILGNVIPNNFKHSIQ